MSFGDFTYKLFYRPAGHFVAWPGGSLKKRGILVEDLKPALRLANCDYGFDDGSGSYAPLEVWRVDARDNVGRVYLIHELLKSPGTPVE